LSEFIHSRARIKYMSILAYLSSDRVRLVNEVFAFYNVGQTNHS
jgi:hypothetical protein